MSQLMNISKIIKRNNLRSSFHLWKKVSLVSIDDWIERMNSQVMKIKEKELEVKDWEMRLNDLQEKLACDHTKLQDTVQEMKSEVQSIHTLKHEIENHRYIEDELKKRASYLASVVLNPIRPVEWAGCTYMVPEEVTDEED